MDFPIIKTDNLILRNLRRDDSQEYWDYVSDTDVKYKFRFNHTRESADERLIALAKRYTLERPPFVWAIASKDEDLMMGIVSIDGHSSVNKSASLACGITQKYRNQGVATEANIALINYLFKVPKLHRIELRCTKGLAVSKRCFEKMGLTYEGIARGAKWEGGQFVDSEVYSVLAHEWQFADMKYDYEPLQGKTKKFSIKKRPF